MLARPAAAIAFSARPAAFPVVGRRVVFAVDLRVLALWLSLEEG